MIIRTCESNVKAMEDVVNVLVQVSRDGTLRTPTLPFPLPKEQSDYSPDEPTSAKGHDEPRIIRADQSFTCREAAHPNTRFDEVFLFSPHHFRTYGICERKRKLANQHQFPPSFPSGAANDKRLGAPATSFTSSRIPSVQSTITTPSAWVRGGRP